MEKFMERAFRRESSEIEVKRPRTVDPGDAWLRFVTVMIYGDANAIRKQTDAGIAPVG